MSFTVEHRTARFCGDLVAAAREPLPPAVEYAAKRSLLNVLATTIGASRSPAVEVMLATARGLDISGMTPVLGRTETVDAHWGALIAGTAGHYDDFDDTHLATVIHPGAATLGALVALHDAPVSSGEEFLRAFAIGCEAQLRIGNAISPNHYDRGWHITGTCGVFGATVAASILRSFDPSQVAAAMAAASTMTLGHREGFGSMTKPFHAGKAAANGVLAARRGAHGSAALDALGDDGVLTMLADEVDEAALFGDWSLDWELERNAFKPYPCGIVAHPVIDAAIDAGFEIGESLASGDVLGIDVLCHPLVPELMGTVQPADGLQARFSAQHGAAVGLLDGKVGLDQFSDARATDPEVAQLRSLTTLTPTDECARDEATLTVRFRDGRAISVHTPHARGSLARPMTDDELLEKVGILIDPLLGSGSAVRLLDAVAQIGARGGFAAVLKAASPATEGVKI